MVRKSERVAKKIVKGFKELSKALAENAPIADNLRRAIELTELGLALRESVLRQGSSDGDVMAEVMLEIRRAKERA